MTATLESLLAKKHLDRLVARVGQASQQAEKKIADLGVTLNRDNPRETLLALVEPLNAIPPADRYKTELTIFGDHCLRFWFVVHDALRTKAPADIIEAVQAGVDVVEAAIDLVTPDEPALEPELKAVLEEKPATTKETAASVKAKSKK